MISDATDSATRLGFWSAVLCTLFSLAYVVAQLFEWAGLLGSAGGPESMSTPFGIALLLTPSLLLGSSFLVLMVSLHQRTPAAKQVWSHAGVAFATAYAVLTGMIYFVQLTVVGPRLARGDIAGMEMFVFVPFDSFLYAVDILGYTFMSVATLFAAFALTDNGIERIARRFMIANGLLIPFLALQMYWHSLIWVAALWAITFPGATAALAMMFARPRHPVVAARLSRSVA
ncbi:MAG TPA: hypothetical protein VFZ69_04975 [Longimicrobiales bacterium]